VLNSFKDSEFEKLSGYKYMGLWLADVYGTGALLISFSRGYDFILQNCCVKKGILFFPYK
jgi:hypothetical protein